MKISVITATYNSAATIADTIESLLGQDYTDWEHVIADGGSTDGTLDIIQSYADRYRGRLSLVSEPDRGIYDAMNKGISRVTGDVVGILNSDDFYTATDVLTTVAGVLSDAATDAVYADIAYVGEDKMQMVRYYSSARFKRWKMRLGFMPAHPSFYCRTGLYKRHGTFDTTYRIAADFENLLRLIYLGKARCRYVPRQFVTMRTGGASTSGYASHRRIFAEHMRAYRANGVYSGWFLDWLRYPFKVAELINTKKSID